jgi:hypothetical protein
LHNEQTATLSNRPDPTMTSRLTKQCAALALAIGALAPAAAETNIGVSVGIHQPGVYGRIDIGNHPPPPVVYAQPMIIARPAVHVVQQPVYLYVPPGHQKNWHKHCGAYGACGQPVYFVQESWVQSRYDEDRGHGRGKKDKHRGRGHDRD